MLYIHGTGAISPAGLGTDALYTAVEKGQPLPTSELAHPATDHPPIPVRCVEKAILKDSLPKHPRLRRSSPVSKFGTIAALQALSPEVQDAIQAGTHRLGIIASFMNGCVNYSNKFFTEVLDDPSFASPIIFPETVFNAPASHFATFLESAGPAYTLLGDSATWFTAMQMAETWLLGDLVDSCLIISSEELDWLSAQGLQLYHKANIPAEGAAAIHISLQKSDLQLEMVSGPNYYTSASEREDAIATSAAAIHPSESDCLVDDSTGIPRLDAITSIFFPGPCLSPKKVLGDALGSSCGFQTITAVEALRQRDYTAAYILSPGGNQHAFSVKLTHTRNHPL